MADPKRKRRPPKSDQEREQHLINLAYDFAEEQFRNGTASSQVTTHFLKVGSARTKLEEEKIKQENLLLEARIEELKSTSSMDELYTKALQAMTLYKGGTVEEEVLDED